MILYHLYQDHCTQQISFLCKLEILKVQDVFNLQVSKFIFDCIHLNTPTNFQNWFLLNYNIHNYNIYIYTIYIYHIYHYTIYTIIPYIPYSAACHSESTISNFFDIEIRLNLKLLIMV